MQPLSGAIARAKQYNPWIPVELTGGAADCGGG